MSQYIEQTKKALECKHMHHMTVARRKTPRGVPVLAMTVLLSVIGIDFVGSRHLVFN
jgi:hypothetical protein